MYKSVILFFFTAIALFSCSQKKNEFGSDISTDQEQIQAGKVLFENNCSTCHNFQQNGIGPNLSGVTHSVETEWVRNFIQDPAKVIDSNDPRAAALFEVYNTYMPAFSSLTDQDINSLLAYIHTYATLPDTVPQTGLADPIPDSIPDSGVRLELEFYTQIPASNPEPPLAKITKLESEPVSGRTFVSDQHGTLYELKDGKHSVYLPLKELRPKLVSKPGLATGFGSYAFHPEFSSNGLLYTSHTEPSGTMPADFDYADSIKVTMQWVLTEWKTDNPEAPTFQGEGREFMRIDVVTQIHGVQELAFNPNSKPGSEGYGLLYIALGDGGSAESGFAFLADHQGSKIWSSIMRIDPAERNSKNGKYGIPENNPFVGKAGKAGEVYAYGFRNPNRVFWDNTGRMFATEIGHHNVEELNRIEPGKFYGWPIREGSFIINPYGDMGSVYPINDQDNKLDVTHPIIQIDHDEIAAIIGGYFMPSGPLEGKWVFGNITSGRLLFADLSDLNNVPVKSWGITFQGKEMDLQELCGSKRVDLKFGQDKTGQIYLMTKADGKIYKIKD
ncbi:PQQ-dependent sugar dehydrogenase [uncultured Algoriphagus sp.]|uniref:PQQ-dependent sugar dehydrogenase n=1 Tax=uncultured Algoriphagus sp. TaxID=417365 RepID=UPI0030EDCB10|tara:strand:- start:51454 stop:53124 length:1671 start_codon:yes stop_codon:yes gene_type:complete